MAFVRLIIFVLIGIALGILFNKFVIKYFSEKNRKILCVVTMLIFICSSISVSVTISIKSYINSTVIKYTGKIEQYIYKIFPDNEFINNGIDLNIIDNTISEINEVILGLKDILPTHTDIKVNKWIYDMVVDTSMELLQGQINSNIDYYVGRDGIYGQYVYMFADNNNFITVSSILNYLATFVNIKINFVFYKIIAVLLIPFLVYIVTTSIVVITIVIKNRKT